MIIGKRGVAFFENEAVLIALCEINHIEKHYIQDDLAGYKVILKNTYWDAQADNWANNAYLQKNEGEKLISQWNKYLEEKEIAFNSLGLRTNAHSVKLDPLVRRQERPLEVGDTVMVFDRYRFAIALKAVIKQKAETNDGVRLQLLQSNNADYPIGCENVWVSEKQCSLLSA